MVGAGRGLVLAAAVTRLGCVRVVSDGRGPDRGRRFTMPISVTAGSDGDRCAAGRCSPAPAGSA